MRSWMDDIYTTIENNIQWISKLPICLGAVGLALLARRRYWLQRWRRLADLPAEVRSGQWTFRVRILGQQEPQSVLPLPSAQPSSIDLVARHEPVLYSTIFSRYISKESSFKLRLAGLTNITPEGSNWLLSRLSGRIVRVRVFELLGSDDNAVGLCAMFQWRPLSLSPFSYQCLAEQLVSSGLARCSNLANADQCADNQHWIALKSRLEAAEAEAKRRQVGLWRQMRQPGSSPVSSSAIGRFKAWLKKRRL